MSLASANGKRKKRRGRSALTDTLVMRWRDGLWEWYDRTGDRRIVERLLEEARRCFELERTSGTWVKRNGGVTFEEYVYARIPGALAEAWYKLGLVKPFYRHDLDYCEWDLDTGIMLTGDIKAAWLGL